MEDILALIRCKMDVSRTSSATGVSSTNQTYRIHWNYAWYPTIMMTAISEGWKASLNEQFIFHQLTSRTNIIIRLIQRAKLCFKSSLHHRVCSQYESIILQRHFPHDTIVMYRHTESIEWETVSVTVVGHMYFKEIGFTGCHRRTW